MIKATSAGDYFSDDHNFAVMVKDGEDYPYQLSAMDINYRFRFFEVRDANKSIISHNLEALEEMMGFLNQVIYAEKQRLNIFY